MPTTFDQGREEVARLAKLFAANQAAYRAPDYKEAHARSEFIDPLFEALGWDVHNKAGVAPQYREVIPEPSLDMEGQVKAPDYAFRVGPSRKFFGEAKKPGVNIRENPAPAYQARRYGWSAKLPVCLLTDFEEFAAYDCRIRPAQKDKASAARVLYCGFEAYADQWRELWDRFSREAVWGGAFDKFAGAAGGKRGTSTVDTEFLKEIEGWRDQLARNIELRNKLDAGDLNDAVQRTIDRIIFLRMAEDRSMEEYGQLGRLADGEKVYAGLLRLFGKAEDKYDSGLFDFQADKLTPKLKVDDKVLATIIKGLYFPLCPYAFNMLPADILGSVYEQFLGKVIRVTDGGHAKVEEKPEVRKAGGVHYTPNYIVDYIVKHTVGKQIEGKSPRQLRDYRVLDKSCGSGSFLLGAYQYLLDHYLKWYVEHDPEKQEDAVRRAGMAGAVPDWRLTIAEKKRVLTAHVYGVDIDRQAVEVTKLSLLLKVLEGETDETVGQQMQLFQERALPNLDNNIKCGNSLIGPAYFAGKLLPDKEEMRRINPFDWRAGFPEAAAAGGFDSIIGNPPYVRIQNMKEWAPREVEIYKELYRSAAAGNYDIYVVFVEKGLSLLRAGGRLGFILPHKFFNAQYGEALRKLLAEGRHLSEIVHFGDQQVFQGATTYTCLMFLDKTDAETCRFAKVPDLDAWRTAGKAEEGAIPAAKIGAAEWNFAVGAGAGLFEKLNAMPTKFGDIADIFVGLQTSADDVFIMDLVKETPRTLQLRSKALSRDWVFEKGLLFPLISGTDVSRYRHLPERQYILFPYTIMNEKASLRDFAGIEREFPKTASYLSENKKRLENREKGKAKGLNWYGYIYLKNMARQAIKKGCVPRLVDELCAAYDHQGTHFLDNVDVGGFTMKPEHSLHDLAFIVGLVNSRLLRWYFPFVSAPFRGGWRSANKQFLSQLPIRSIDFAKPADKAAHDQMVALVERMLDLHKQLAACKSESDRPAVERLIASTDAEIDRLVYKLYGLTEEEVRIVGGMRGP